MISVIVPVYNVELYIRRCIDSILCQSHTDFELILVDDGSPDNCGAICDEYSNVDSRVRVIHQVNGGLSAARNAGLAQAKGEWVSFIDGDDWIHPDFLSVLLKKVCDDGTDIAICSIKMVSNNQNDKRTGLVFEVERSVLNQQELVNRQVGLNAWIFVGACNKLFRKNLFKDIQYPEGFVHEDAAIWHRILARCSAVSLVEEAMYFYWQHPESITNSVFSIKRTDHLSAWADRICFTHLQGWKAWEQATIKMFTENFFDYYFRFQRTKENEMYFKRMEQSLKRILPYILQDRNVSIRHKLYFFLMNLNPTIYTTIRKVFRH